jgi:hypothetical protein
MKWIALIAVTFIPVFSIAQNYIDYYTNVNEAKKKVIEGVYDSALVIYKETFDTFEFEYARDCVNATEVAAFVNNHELTKFFLECSLKRGIPLVFFYEQGQFEEFRKTAYWSQLTGVAEQLYLSILLQMEQFSLETTDR